MPLVIMNSGWTDGGDIPAKYAGAAGVSPALSWSGAPMTTQSFLLIMHDMDVAPQRGADDVLHWIMWDIPATTTMLPEGLKAGDQADGSRIGRGITGQNAYFGPGPPAGHPAHHYVIELYALDVNNASGSQTLFMTFNLGTTALGDIARDPWTGRLYVASAGGRLHTFEVVADPTPSNP